MKLKEFLALEAKKPAKPEPKSPAVKSPSGSPWEGQKNAKAYTGKLDPDKWPMLKAYWDDYGHDVAFNELDGIKCQRGCYCVVRWKNKDGTVGIADLARSGIGQPWEMQNDGFDDLTEADWRKLKIVPECDWFEIPGNPDFERD